jgi:SAM-dependent methyltransferase
VNRQDFYRDKYKKINPSWLDSVSIYRDEILKNIHPKSIFLDIGCGHSNALAKVSQITSYTYGIDPDKEALSKNVYYNNLLVGSADKLPFQDNTFDVVAAAWVAEHLQNPEIVLEEIYRVLKPGGKFFFITPNVWNYNVWIIRMIPERFHSFFTTRLYDRGEGDTYPKVYQLNSQSKIKELAIRIGYKSTNIILNGDPSYISFNRITFFFARLLEMILSLKPFCFMKVHLIVNLEK